MANLFFDLPVPAGNGAGAGVDVSQLGWTRTITVKGAFAGTVTIEGSGESIVGPWAPIISFQNVADERIINIAAPFMRAVRAGVPGVGPAGLPNVDVGANDNGTMFTDVPVTPADGVGPAVDVSNFGTFKTIYCLGAFTGQVTFELSEDGVSWAQITTFTIPGQRSFEFTSQFVRAVRAATGGVPGLPDVSLAAVNDPVSSFVAGGGNCLIYQPGGGEAGPVVFASWVELMGQLATLRNNANDSGCYVILVDDSVVQPATSPPAGLYDMTNVELAGMLRPGQFGHAQLLVDEGVRFANLYSFQDIDVRHRATATPVITAVNGDVFFVGPDADISSFAPGAVPFFDGSGLGAGAFYVLRLQGSIGSQGQATPLASVAAGAALLADIRANGILQKNVVSGPVGAFLGIELTDTSALFGPQAAFLGTTDLNFSNTNVGPRLNFDPLPGVAPLVGPTTIQARDGVVRASAAGGPFTLTLEAMPTPSFNEFGRPLVVVETSGTAGLSVAPAAGDTINGLAASIAVPARGAVILVPDGISDWRVIAAGSTTTGTARPAVLAFGVGNIGAAAGTRFLNPWGTSDTGIASTTGTEEDMPVPGPGTIRNLFVRHDAAVGNGNSVVYTLHKNGVATALTVTLATGAVGQASDLVNTVAVVQGDQIRIEVVKALVIGNGGILPRATMEFAA